ncbi:hypothetical protein KKC06_03000, partial [Patescibacteria group bacterium]|nr:hypothetical protein [Patescibacteria group bacterium]
NFNGFTAVTCGKCKKKANVLVGGQGWICTCEHYNVQVIHGANIPHENPDLGPTRAFLQAAYAKAEEKKKQAT